MYERIQKGLGRRIERRVPPRPCIKRRLTPSETLRRCIRGTTPGALTVQIAVKIEARPDGEAVTCGTHHGRGPLATGTASVCPFTRSQRISNPCHRRSRKRRQEEEQAHEEDQGRSHEGMTDHCGASLPGIGIGGTPPGPGPSHSRSPSWPQSQGSVA